MDENFNFTDKWSRNPAIVELYRAHDYLTAYAKHTDLRVQADPHQAVGGNWDSTAERDLLIEQGLRPEHTLLDFACGTGRLARQIVPYLNAGNYTGVDISRGAVEYCWRLAIAEGWLSKKPDFESISWLNRNFDYAWAFSVFAHLPSDIAAETIKEIAARSAKFYFSCSLPDKLPDNTRTGLNQFAHPLSFYEEVARDLDYSLTEIKWSGKKQRILLMENG